MTLHCHTFKSGSLSHKVFDRTAARGEKNCPGLRVSNCSPAVIYCYSVTVSFPKRPGAAEERKEAVPCYQELQNSLRQNQQRISRWAQDESKAIPGLKGVTFTFCKVDQVWFYSKKKEKEKRKFESEDKNKCSTAKAALKKIHYHPE